MKLINRSILNFLLISIPVLAMAGLISYYLIKNELKEGVDEDLARERNNIVQIIPSLTQAGIVYLSDDSLSSIRPVGPQSLVQFAYSDTSILNPRKKKMRQYRIIRGTSTYNGRTYLITLARNTAEEDELLSDLFTSFTAISLFLVSCFFLTSWVYSKRLWRPFYKTLRLLERYDIRNHGAVKFPPEGIAEFDQLNQKLNKMTERLQQDYIQQKEFTENASHEMQTPLAVLRANISLLMQSLNVGEQEMSQLQAMENTVRKLTTLNKTLILLAKIDNDQYHETENVNLKARIKSALDFYDGALQTRKIKVRTNFHSNPEPIMNPSLADTLINNLLQNAIRHNSDNGQIEIVLYSESLTISNSGPPLAVAGTEMFARFSKSGTSNDSLGLGLSIVKSITTLYGMDIRYSFTGGLHSFTLIFLQPGHQ